MSFLCDVMNLSGLYSKSGKPHAMSIGSNYSIYSLKSSRKSPTFHMTWFIHNKRKISTFTALINLGTTVAKSSTGAKSINVDKSNVSLDLVPELAVSPDRARVACLSH